MDRKKKKILDWYINLVNADFGKLSDRKKNMLASEVAAQIHPQKLYESPFEPGAIREAIADEIGPGLLKKRNLPEIQEKLRDLSKSLKDFFEYMMGEIKHTRDRKEGNWLPSDQAYFPTDLTAFKTEKPVTIRLETDGISFEEKKNKSDQGEKKLLRLRADSVEKAKITLTLDSENDKDVLLFNFARLIEGSPIGAFRQCRECEHWFVHFSRREKKYCSNKCAVRFGSKKRRKEKKIKKPKAYEVELRASSERARKSYVKRIKTKVPGAKPKRRPYKYK